MKYKRELFERTCKCGKVQMVQAKNLNSVCKKCAGRERWVKYVLRTTGQPPKLTRRIRDHSKYREPVSAPIAKPHPNMKGVRYEDVPLKKSPNSINGDALARQTLRASPCGSSIVMCMET